MSSGRGLHDIEQLSLWALYSLVQMWSPFINPNCCVSLYEIAVTSPPGDCDWSKLRPLNTWPCAASPPTVSSSSSDSITLLGHAVLTAEAPIVCLTDWLTAWLRAAASEEERAAASRQPISGSGLANVQPRGSSTTVSATARATSLKLGYYGDKEREHFAGGPPLSPPRFYFLPPNFTPLFFSLPTGHSA